MVTGAVHAGPGSQVDRGGGQYRGHQGSAADGEVQQQGDHPTSSTSPLYPFNPLYADS